MALANGRLSMPRWYLLVAIVGSMLLLSLAGVVYTNWSIHQQDRAERANDQRWCKLLTTLDEAYQATPPQTPTGQRLAADIHKLRQELGCG
jgi:hypothetical protein